MKDLIVILCFLGFFLVIVWIGIREEKKEFEKRRQRIQMAYGKKRPRGRISAVASVYYAYQKERFPADFCLDALTWKDLEGDRVYDQLNHTFSFVGEAYLYDQLRRWQRSEASLGKLHHDISFLQEHTALREALSVLYDRTGKRFQGAIFRRAASKSDRNGLLLHMLNFLLWAAGICMLFLSTGYGLLLLIGAIIYSIWSYFYMKKRQQSLEELLKEILALCYLGADVEAALSQFVKPLEEGEEGLPCAHMQEILKTLRPLQRSAKYLYGMNYSAGGLFRMLFSYVHMFFHFDLLLLHSIEAKLEYYSKQSIKLFEELGYLEYCMALASFRESLPYYCRPTYEGNPKGEEVYHFLLEHPVANAVNLERPILLTGSNASGKSTYIRTVALNIWLSLTTATAAARSFSAEPCALYSAINLGDCLEQGESFFLAEGLALKRMLTAGEQWRAGERKRRPVFFLDEILRGTNTMDRIALGAEILSHFARLGLGGIAATHDLELTYLLEESYHNYHFKEEMMDGRLCFSYRLEEGACTSRNAIALLEGIGYDETVIEGAKRKASYFEETGAWRDKK